MRRTCSADYSSSDFLSDRGETRDADDKRTLVDLLVEQIEFADVVVVNKISEVTAETRLEVRRIIAALNPDARVVETDFGHLPLAAILDTGLFDEAKAARHPLWHKELYRRRQLMCRRRRNTASAVLSTGPAALSIPQGFTTSLQQDWPGLIRAKGHFWLATRPDWVGLLSIAGAQRRAEAKGLWWAAVPKQSLAPPSRSSASLLDRHWKPVWGDRRQELVFIGTGLAEDAIRSALDACLIGSETGFDPQALPRPSRSIPAMAARPRCLNPATTSNKTETTMSNELYADGIGEITVTGSIVRIDLMSLSATERDEKNNPKPVFRQRIIMPVDAFANAVDLMQKALGGLVEAGAVRRIGDVQKLPTADARQSRRSAAASCEIRKCIAEFQLTASNSRLRRCHEHATAHQSSVPGIGRSPSWRRSVAGAART